MDDKTNVEYKFYKLVYGNIFNFISDDIYLFKIQKLINDHLDLDSIANIKKIIYLLKINKKKLSYLFTLLTYSKQCLYKSILHYVDANKKLNLYVSICDPSQTLDCVIKLRKYLLESTDYIKAFTSLNSMDDLIKIENKKYIKQNENTNIIHRVEIVERLGLLVDYYRSYMLKYYGVELLSRNNIDTLSYCDLVSYYNTTVKIIKNGHKTIIDICDMYLDIQRGIIYLTMTKRPIINTKKFDVYIENELSGS
jgi:hypothetical protein